MKHFSKHWISSTKPNKQRKYRFNAPMHIRGEFLNAHLSKELRAKYGLRSLRLRVGDHVRIMRGQFKKQEGKVEEVDLRSVKAYISKIEHTKRDGTKARYPIEPSNLMIVELNNDDKKRLKQKNTTAKAAKADKVERTEKASAEPVKKAAKPAPKTDAVKKVKAVKNDKNQK